MRLIALLSTLVLFSALLAPSADSEEDMNDWISRILAVSEAAFDYKCDPAYSVLTESVKDARFERLAPRGQAMVHRGIANCAVLAGDKAEARASFESWRALNLEDEMAWTYRWQLYEEADWDNPIAALDLLGAWLAGGEAMQFEPDLREILTVRRAITDHLEGDEMARALIRLNRLQIEHAYQVKEPDFDPSYDYLLLARAHLRLGEPDKAKAQAAKATEAMVLATIHTLKRDEPLRSSPVDISESGLTALFEADLKRVQQKAKDNRFYLSLEIEVAQLLRRLNRLDEAAAILEAAEENLKKRPPRYADQFDEVNWLYNELGHIYFARGEIDRGVNSFSKGIFAGEDGSENVSQVLNLSYSLLYKERYQEALATLTFLGETSDYGTMFEKQIKACASHELGQIEDAEVHLAYLVENKDDSPGALQHTYFCMEREDDAAALLVERLADPVQSERALANMHATSLDPAATAFQRRMFETEARVIARPEVQAAAAKVGQIITLPGYDTYWGGF